METQSELAAAEAELDKQRVLNNKLENDLLQLETHNPKGINGDATPIESDVLAGLDLKKKNGVSRLHHISGNLLMIENVGNSRQK